MRRRPRSFVELDSPTAAPAASHRTPPIVRDAASRFLIYHGIGQQVQLEDSTTSSPILCSTTPPVSMMTRTNESTSKMTAPPSSTSVSAGRGARGLTLPDAHGGEVRVHVYEAYWAPLTAGKVSLRQVVAFLLDAGLGGLAAARRTFLRWMFGGWQEFARSYRAFAELAVAILFVLYSLMLANATIVVIAASRGIGHRARAVAGHEAASARSPPIFSCWCFRYKIRPVWHPALSPPATREKTMNGVTAGITTHRRCRTLVRERPTSASGWPSPGRS